MAYRRGGILTGTYANRPAAATANSGYFYLATDCGLDGALFVSNGSAWKHVGTTTLGRNTSLVTISPSSYATIFSATPSLPNGCLGSGSTVSWWADVIAHGGAGQNSFGDLYVKALIGSTSMGETTTSQPIYGDNPARMHGMTTVHTTGASGAGIASAMGQMLYGEYPTPKHINKADYATTTVDTTGSISPDIQMKLINPVNSPTLYIQGALMLVSGLV
jgi:hypothetical protein